MSRDDFLARVRQAAHAGRAYRVPAVEIPPEVGYVGSDDDLCAALAREVNEVGGTAHLVDDLDAARGTLRDLLREFDARSALCWRHPLLERLGLADLLGSLAVSLHDYDSLVPLDADARREKMLAADVAISSVDCAIAETGTLLVCSAAGQERVASLLAPRHVAVVQRAQIVPDLFDAIGSYVESGPDSLPSNLSLITGPSKTGDIELQLTTGVHGPGQWHVIVVR